MRAVIGAAALAATLCAAPALAHRLSPAYFGLTETAPNAFDVQWKVSISGGLAGVLEPRVPDGCSLTESVRTYVVDDVRLQHGALSCPDGLGGKEFRSTASRRRRPTCCYASTTSTARRRMNA
jgi:hypothetical protein